MYYPYKNSSTDELYIINENELDKFAKEIFNPITMTFLGVSIEAHNAQEALAKYDEYDVMSSEEPNATKFNVDQRYLKLPKYIRQNLGVLIMSELAFNQQKERLITSLSQRLAVDTSMNKSQAQSYLRDILEEYAERGRPLY